MKIYMSAANAKRLRDAQDKVVTQVRPELFLPFDKWPTTDARK